MSTDLGRQLQDQLGADYRIERELGGGGMSRVFLAEETKLGRRVVVKVMSPEQMTGFSTDRFEREIRVAARLQDPRIVPLLQAGHLGDLPFFTMPYVEGESLRARLTRGRLSTDEAIGVLRDVALALEYAHARQVIHRDIKPENILLTGRTAVVADFGIAKAMDAATLGGSPHTLTANRSIVGTPAYMAPEQAVGDAVDQRADLYAWGVIAYELLSGAHPFAQHRTAHGVLTAHLTESPVSLAAKCPSLPASLTSLVDACLAKDPAQRPRSSADILSQLTTPAAAPAEAPGRGRILPWVAAAALTALGIGAGAFWFWRSEQQRWAREDAVREADRLRAASRAVSAVQVLQRARRILPGDSAIDSAFNRLTVPVAIGSSPSGATIEIQDYLATDGPWLTVGVTPVEKVRVPDGYFRWRVSKAGLGTDVVAPGTGKEMHFALDSALQAPPGMRYVPANVWANMIAFVGWVGPYQLPGFYIDRLEVTNRDYQVFVDSGGYQKREYWTEPFVERGRTLGWDEATARFRDRTGRAGPSTWEGGHYASGRGDYPVSGVSWFEAAAYARFVGKSLPTFSQWFEAAPDDLAPFLVRESNIARDSVAPVGSFKGLGPFGTFDMAGNVREWTLNALDADRRFVLGGMWRSPTYLTQDPEALSPFDRSSGNGFRCVRNLAPLPANAISPVKPLDRDFTRYVPASDPVFRAYRVMYAYGKAPLNATSEGTVADERDWRKEKVSFSAAYGTDRISAYLFLPKKVKPPYQTVIFFPSARVLHLTNSATLGDTADFDYIVQSGRAVMYPVYQETYERRSTGSLPSASQEIDITVQRSKDVMRAMDYLRTRPDIDTARLAYLGVSMGAAEGVIYATLAQDRLKTAVFLDGGYFLGKAPPGGDQADFAPRLKVPVLMVNGRFDFTFSYERSQLPLFRALGTPSADKRHVVLETPHDVTSDRPRLVLEVLGWLDKYLGRVN